MTTSEIEQLMQRFRSLLAAEYHRGEQDAIARIMKAAQGIPAATNGNADVASAAGRKERAPVGAAKALVDRVLTERGQRGATAAEIHEAATTQTEKLVSFPGIRFTLTTGREDQRYRNKGGKWFLRREKESAGHGAHDPAATFPRSDSR